MGDLSGEIAGEIAINLSRRSYRKRPLLRQESAAAEGAGNRPAAGGGENETSEPGSRSQMNQSQAS